MKNLTKKILASFLFTILTVLMFGTLIAKETTFRDQAWRYGLNLGFQFNSISLGYQNLRAPFPNFYSGEDKKDNSDGKGVGVYGGIFVEYLSDSWWGVQLRVSYDMRDGLVKDTTTRRINDQGVEYNKANGDAYETKMNYLSFEPMFRIDQRMIPNLSIAFGPILAVNIHGTYDYRPDVNSSTVTETNQKIDNRNIISYGISGGFAYDIEISRNNNNNSSFFVSPFAEASWIVNQKKSDNFPVQNSVTDVWSTLSYRFGIRLSWESRYPEEEKVTEVRYIPQPYEAPRKVETPAGKRVFVVMPYENTIVTKNVSGYFPVHPYVFFDKGNTEIPSRYILLSKSESQNFNETDLQNFKKGDMTVQETNVNQLMVTYYNVLNIYGDRMRDNPNEQLTLSGCDPADNVGTASCDKVKNYLVYNYGIDANRIKIVIESPRKPSGSELTDPAFTEMINDENRRVGFVFSNQNMYKPIPYTIMDESSIDNDMIFSIDNTVQFRSWNLSISGENKIMNFGPFKYNRERINPAPLMRGLDDGNFNAKVVITMNDGKQVTENVDFILHKEKEFKNSSRYLMIFDYNKSDAVLTYETKIRKEIAPGMKPGNSVIVHGHTDIIGNEEANQKLSQERADEAKRIIDDQLGKDNKKISVQAIGVGQANMPYTFENRYPEGRMYNRNVFVEIIQ